MYLCAVHEAECGDSHSKWKSIHPLFIMIENKDFLIDEIYGERLLVSVKADKTELIDGVF